MYCVKQNSRLLNLLSDARQSQDFTSGRIPREAIYLVPKSCRKGWSNPIEAKRGLVTTGIEGYFSTMKWTILIAYSKDYNH